MFNGSEVCCLLCETPLRFVVWRVARDTKSKETMNDAGAQVMDAHLANARNAIPPPLRGCCPDSTSTVIRNLILSLATLNGLLLLGCLFTVGTRNLGSTAFVLACISCGHAVIAAMVLGSHVVESIESVGNRSAGQIASLLRTASALYEMDVYAHGFLLGSTFCMSFMMHVLSVFFGGVADCIDKANQSGVSSEYNLTGGYANLDSQLAQHQSNAYLACGSSGPVSFVAFISGLLFWVNATLTCVLFTKRSNLINGTVGNSAGGGQYDEIGGGSFQGDFPGNGQQRVMHV